MSKETTIKTQLPKLRFPEFMDMGKWEKKLVEEYFNVGSSKRVFQKDWVNDGVPFYRTRELVSLSKNESFGREIYISEELFLELSEKHGVPTKGDFLVSGVGTIGVSYQVKSGDKFYFKDGNVLWFKLLQGLVSDYFKYCLQSQIIQSQILGKASISTVGTYTIQNAKKTEFWLAYSPDEQQKIADCLSSIDDLITAQAQKIESLKDHKKGLMQQLFPAEGETVPKLRFPEFLDKGGWQEVKLSQLGKLISGLTYTPDDIRDNGLLVLRSSNVQDGKIDLEDNVFVIPDIKGANLSRPNDILICVRNGSVALIGKNALIPEGMPLCTHGAFMTIFRAKTADFVFQLFQTHAYYRQVAGDLGATINSINGGKFIKYCFRIPTLPEQQKIADCLSSIDDLITAQAQKVESLKAHKKGLMQQLFPVDNEGDM